MLSLACSEPIDLVFVSSVPFLFYWALLFYGWTLAGWVLHAWTKADTGYAQPLAPQRYLLVAILSVVFVQGFVPQLAILIPVAVYRAGRVLGSEDGTASFRSFLKVSLAAGAALFPVAYLRLLGPKWEYLDLQIGVGAAVPVLLAALFASSWARGREERDRIARWRARRAQTPRRPPRRRRVRVQPQQGCPLCWEVFVPGVAELAECPACETVTHRQCAREMGGCPTLGCARSRVALSRS